MSEAPFVQIAVGTDHTPEMDNLYALDGAGMVWLYDWAKDSWEPIGMTRQKAKR